jgi:hypothetical protein
MADHSPRSHRATPDADTLTLARQAAYHRVLSWLFADGPDPEPPPENGGAAGLHYDTGGTQGSHPNMTTDLSTTEEASRYV